MCNIEVEMLKKEDFLISCCMRPVARSWDCTEKQKEVKLHVNVIIDTQ
jgi:hypothetical protein